MAQNTNITGNENDTTAAGRDINVAGGDIVIIHPPSPIRSDKNEPDSEPSSPKSEHNTLYGISRAFLTTLFFGKSGGKKAIIIFIVIVPITLLAWYSATYRPWPASDCPYAAANIGQAQECWEPIPLIPKVKCRYYRNGAYTLWKDCSENLMIGDKIRFVIQAPRDGWLYAWYEDAAKNALRDIVPDQTRRKLKAGETLIIPKNDDSFEFDGKMPQENFCFLFAKNPIADVTLASDVSLFRSGFRNILWSLDACRTVNLSDSR
uniref:DUF4384 domain-containing protein n=1 Tax=Candidatus Kentrum sp. DK TaxID=2126562 RepID=A0A450T140_9GAMM|nr:MAG: protein of unknown function (DUF4384) [Candidatus Kentron sp. DK]VFJ61312.1 MAG: protein of unknown function (DUF4384) [Candidatus Kentron sp. DK]